MDFGAGVAISGPYMRAHLPACELTCHAYRPGWVSAVSVSPPPGRSSLSTGRRSRSQRVTSTSFFRLHLPPHPGDRARGPSARVLRVLRDDGLLVVFEHIRITLVPSARSTHVLSMKTPSHNVVHTVGRFRAAGFRDLRRRYRDSFFRFRCAPCAFLSRCLDGCPWAPSTLLRSQA